MERASARMIADGAALETQMSLLSRVANALRTRQIPFALLKSAALRLVAYASPNERRSRDIDIAVNRQHLEDVSEVLEECGFAQAQWRDEFQSFEVADPLLRAAVEEGHHELGFWVRVQERGDLDAEIRAAVLAQSGERPAQWEIVEGEELATYVVVDVHHGLSLDIPVDDIIASARNVKFRDDTLPVPRGGWLLFHLVYKIYAEGSFNYCEGAYQYADLCRLIPRLSDNEIAFFAEQVERYHLRAGAYYVLRRLPSDLATPLPKALADLIAEWSVPSWNSNPAAENDWGDMWPKLWGCR